MSIDNLSRDTGARIQKVVDRSDDMAALDKLPPRLRAAIQNARFKWNAIDPLELLAAGMTEDEVIEAIEKTERKIMGGAR